MISVLLVKHKADELSSGDIKKVTIFLAPKVDLVLQVQISPAAFQLPIRCYSYIWIFCEDSVLDSPQNDPSCDITATLTGNSL